jgi:hypothetical protein
MRKTMPTLVKLLPVALFVSVFLSSPNVANADEVFIQGYTNACFCLTNDPVNTPVNTSATQTDTLLGLTFVNATFSGTTAGGFLGLNGSPVAPPTQNVNNLGALFLSTTPATYLNEIALRVTFTAPEGIFGSLKGSLVFEAVIRGTVTSDPISGGVTINFSNIPTLLTFTDPNCGNTTVPLQQTTCGMGTFSFRVNPISILPGQLVPITGQITGAQQTAIPEPATMFLLSTGLAGIAARFRRRRCNAKKNVI